MTLFVILYMYKHISYTDRWMDGWIDRWRYSYRYLESDVCITGQLFSWMHTISHVHTSTQMCHDTERHTSTGIQRL